MPNSNVGEVSADDVDLAAEVLMLLADRLGDHACMEVHADKLFRIACLVCAMVINADKSVSGKSAVASMSTSLAFLIEEFSMELRRMEQEDGVEIMSGLLEGKRPH